MIHLYNYGKTQGIQQLYITQIISAYCQVFQVFQVANFCKFAHCQVSKFIGAHCQFCKFTSAH